MTFHAGYLLHKLNLYDGAVTLRYRPDGDAEVKAVPAATSNGSHTVSASIGSAADAARSRNGAAECGAAAASTGSTHCFA